MSSNEIVESILNFIAIPSVSGLTLLGILFVQVGKTWRESVKRNKEIEIAKIEWEAKVKIARIKSRTNLKLAEKGYKHNSDSPPMTRAS